MGDGLKDNFHLHGAYRTMRTFAFSYNDVFTFSASNNWLSDSMMHCCIPTKQLHNFLRIQQVRKGTNQTMHKCATEEKTKDWDGTHPKCIASNSKGNVNKNTSILRQNISFVITNQGPVGKHCLSWCVQS